MRLRGAGLLFAGTLSTLTVSQEGTRLPVVQAPDPSEWRAASSVDPREFFDQQGVDEETLELLRERGRTTHGEPCLPGVNMVDGNQAPPPATLEEAVANAAVVVVGTVLSAEPGFAGDTPGIMLELAARELKGPASWQEGEPLFVFFEGGRVPVGDEVLCVSLGGYPLAPEAGDCVVVAPYPWILERQLGERQSFLTINGGPNEMIVFWFERTQEFHVSSSFREVAPAISDAGGPDELLRRLEAAANEVRR